MRDPLRHKHPKKCKNVNILQGGEKENVVNGSARANQGIKHVQKFRFSFTSPKRRGYWTLNVLGAISLNQPVYQISYPSTIKTKYLLIYLALRIHVY